MHHKFAIAIILNGLFIQTFGQETHIVFDDTINDKSILKVSSFNHYASNRVNNQLIDKFLFGGDITQEIKDDNFARLKNFNSIGGEFEQRIDSYSPDINPFKKEKYGLMLSFSDNHFISANWSKDLFETVLYGNANSLGDTMDFSFVHAQYQHYQKLSFGFYDKRTFSSIQLSFVTGSKTLNFHSSDSWLLSHAAGDSVTLQLKAQGLSSARSFPYWAFQGAGFSIDLNYNFLFNSKQGNRQIINLRINNLGAIFWNNQTQSYYVDSMLVYDGFDVKDFINRDTATVYNFKDTLGIVKTIGKYTDVLPMELVVEKLADRQSPNKVQAIFGFKAVLTQDYRPYLYAGAYFQPNQKFSTSTNLAYGGFGGFRWGLNFNYWPTDNMYFSLGTVDLIGLVSKNFGFGRSANFTAYFKL